MFIFFYYFLLKCKKAFFYKIKLEFKIAKKYFKNKKKCLKNCLEKKHYEIHKIMTHPNLTI